ncbi:hypothetical protein F4677DRAFT_461532 [Hypoxylon crocopeplum]|nr:hypothetical protein F4677DRAFT_461532 [Hypoxylon crocopeplum]
MLGPIYLNPNVVADIEEACLEEVSKGRIRLTGIRGSAPPPTAKLAVYLQGGWQAELSGVCAGLDTDFKFQIMKDQVINDISSTFQPGILTRSVPTMRMAVTSYDNRLLPHVIAHAAKAAMGVLKGDIVSVDNVEALLQVHASTECFPARAREHGCA